MAAQSPLQQTAGGDLNGYLMSWAVTARMMSEGKSFSAHEKKCCFLNTSVPGVKSDGPVRFADASSATGFDFPDDGRAIGVVDWDFDGALDFWTCNRNAPRVRFMKNHFRAGHHWLTLRLRGDGQKTSRDAIGARVELEIGGARPRKLIRGLRAGEGYLSQSAKMVHFGLGADREIRALRVRWPGGGVEEFRGAEPDGVYVLVQGAGRAERWRPPSALAPITPSEQPKQPPSEFARVTLAARPYLSPLETISFDGLVGKLQGPFAKARFVALWSPTCPACVTEFAELKRTASKFTEAGVELLALEFPVQGTPEDPKERAVVAKDFWNKHGFGGEALLLTERSASVLEAFQKALSERIKPLGAPSGVLLDREGRVAVVYKGATPMERILADVALLALPDEKIRDSAVAAPGSWFTDPSPPNPARIALGLQDAGLLEEARGYLEHFLSSKYASVSGSGPQIATAHLALAGVLTAMKNDDGAVQSWELAVKADPKLRTPHLRLGNHYLHRHQFDQADQHLAAALRMKKDDPDTLSLLAMARMGRGKLLEAEQLCVVALRLQPGNLAARYNLAFALQRQGKDAEAVRQYRLLLEATRHPIAANNLAWILACSPQDALRDGPSALRLAEELVKSAGDSQPIFLATLAAALAENGKFSEAALAAERAIGEVRSAAPGSKMIGSLTRQRELYRSGKPCREAIGTP